MLYLHLHLAHSNGQGQESAHASFNHSRSTLDIKPGSGAAALTAISDEFVSLKLALLLLPAAPGLYYRQPRR